jgi:hypothetical protein
MSLVKPCTSTAAWPWYRPPCPAAPLGELAPPAKSCYVTRAFSAAPGGDMVIADGAENLCAEATYSQSSEEKNG